MNRYRIQLQVGKAKFVATTVAANQEQAEIQVMRHVKVLKVEEVQNETIEPDPEGVWEKFDELFDRVGKLLNGK